MSKKNIKKIANFTLVLAMTISTFHLDGIQLFAAGKENLALGKPVSASYHYPADKFKPEMAVDGKMDTRWAAEEAPTGGGVNQWLMVDLGDKETFNQFLIVAETAPADKAAQNIGKYKIEGSNDTGETKEFTPIYVSEDKSANGGFAIEQTINLEEEVSYRFVRIYIEKLIDKAYPSISLAEFQIYQADPNEQDPLANVALGKVTQTSGNEDPAFPGDKAVDGDTTSKGSRWASKLNQKPSWISIDFGEAKDVQTIKLFWERRNAIDYEIQTANTETAPLEEDWATQASFKKAPAEKNQKVVLEEAVKARFVRVKINNYINDADGVNWGTVSLYEVEVYGGLLQVDIDEVTQGITLADPTADETTLDVSGVIANEDYAITYNGTDYEQVIGTDLTIYKPLVDTVVKVSFKVTDKTTKEYKFKEVAITVPGKYTQSAEDNQVPAVLPELREWKGATGNFSVTENSKVIVGNTTLKETADIFAADYKDMTGKTLNVQVGDATTAKPGDFVFALTTDKSKGLQDEGYLLNITDSAHVEAETTKGVYWATRTILQVLKENENTTMPKGETRDYPLYKVRGVILDVARKPFSFEWIKDFTKEMSWYKMNDFQIHLNDNYIFLEDYTNKGLDPMQAYSGFRLESDIKKGGNNGLNKADLTSTDVFYTKDEFKKFIKDSRSIGVNIVPEIDTPAHSLALTKVRPDLRLGTSGRQNDHLNLVDKYDDSLSFVQSIFSEYMDGADPVFDDQTTIHVGADEFSSSSVKFRDFCNDMFKFVKDTGRKARVWGSLTEASVGAEVPGEGVEINLWNFGYANMDEMYEDGFDLINCDDGRYYIVPNAGYYGDYLNDSTMYNQSVNSISNVTIPAGDKQMVGGAIALWNDMVDMKSNGVSQYDVYDRLQAAMPLYAANVWGKGTANLAEAKARAASLGESPNTNLRYEVDSKDANLAQYDLDTLKDSSGNGYHLSDGENAAIKDVDFDKALKLNGEKSFVTSPIKDAGLGNDLRVKVKRTSDSRDEQILFESSNGSIKAVQKDTGKVGFSRELYDYSFNYELPVNVWVELEFKNVLNVTELYVNGVLVDTLGDDERSQGRPYIATLIFPTERIGSLTKAFDGYVKDIRLASEDDYASTINLDLALLNAKSYLSASKADAELEALCVQAEALLNVYNPDKEAIDNLSDSILEKLDSLDFEKASYDNLDKIAALMPADVSLFTAASVHNVEQVLAGVQRNLHKELQSTVDGYTKSLQSAINDLEVKNIGDLTTVDSSTLKATADSSQGGEGPNSAIDGNTSTIWHTAYNNTTMPHWLVLELPEVTEINAYSYLPRQSGTNGNITSYEIWVSETGNKNEDYKKVASGDWGNNASEKKVSFDPVNAKYVKLVATKAIGNFASAAEVKLYRANVEPDNEGLKIIIKEASSIKGEGFTKRSWNDLQNAIKEAVKIADNTEANPNDVANAKNAVMRARISLQLEGTVADKSELESELANAIVKEEAGYEKDTTTSSSWAAYETALTTAKKLNSDKKATQLEVNKAAEALKTTMEALVLRATAEQFEALAVAIEEAEAIYKGQDDAIYNELKAVVADAKALQNAADKSEVSFASINDALGSITKAKEGAILHGLLQGLQAIIASAKGIDTSDLQPALVADLHAAIANAEALIKNGSTDQEAIKAAGVTITKAIDALAKIVDKAQLNDLVKGAQALNEKAYTKDTYQPLKEALNVAEEVMANGDATEAMIKEVYLQLLDAISNLVLQKDMDALTTYLQTAEAMLKNKNLYTPASVTALEKAIAEATSVVNNKKATAKDIEKAVNSLLDIITSAKFKADKNVLEATILQAEKANVEYYTADSAKLFSDALANAKTVLKNEEATQAEVDAALKALIQAQQGLIVKEDVKSEIDTGDNTNTTLLLVLLIASGGLVFYVYLRRNKHKKLEMK